MENGYSRAMENDGERNGRAHPVSNLLTLRIKDETNVDEMNESTRKKNNNNNIIQARRHSFAIHFISVSVFNFFLFPPSTSIISHR